MSKPSFARKWKRQKGDVTGHEKYCRWSENDPTEPFDEKKRRLRLGGEGMETWFKVAMAVFELGGSVKCWRCHVWFRMERDQAQPKKVLWGMAGKNCDDWEWGRG